MAGSIENLLDWFKDNIKRISTRALETIARIVYTIPLAEDWQYTDPVASWTCPEGQYECFVYLDTDPYIEDLNGKPLVNFSVVLPAGPAIGWVPAIFSLARSGAAADPETWISQRAPKGWELSTGEGFKNASAAFIVRYRRIA